MANQILYKNKSHLVLHQLIESMTRRHISRTAETPWTSLEKYAIFFKAHPLSLSKLYKLVTYDLKLMVKSEYRSQTSLESLYNDFPPELKELKKVGVAKQFL